MSRQDQNTFLYGTNATFIAELYSRYLADPSSVDESWRSFFAELAEQAPDVLKDLDGPGWGRGRSHGLANGHAEPASGNGQAAAAVLEAPAAAPETRQATLDALRALSLIRAYRVRGHLLADLDPLGLVRLPEHPDLDPKPSGFPEAHSARPLFVNGVLGFQAATLRQILDALKATSCGHLAIQHLHIQHLTHR